LAFTLDMEAAARVARRVQLLEVRLTDLNVKRTSGGEASSLSADVNRNCTPLKWENGSVEVSCQFHFQAMDAGAQIAFIDVIYLLRYSVDGQDAVAEADAKHFAYANGAYNCWPFARELFHGLTSRMSLPPFTLPVLAFAPPKPKAKEHPKALPAVQPGVKL
jgi:preprotein translocase subunit SecB